MDEKYVVEIVKDYDKLSYRSTEFDIKKLNKECKNMILEMKATMRANNLLGLSACQIGYYARVICLNFNGDIRTFINPIITKSEGFELSKETCSSLEGTYIRPRNSKVDILYQTPLGKTASATLVGFAAKLFQHHLDHLDGILISDIGLLIDEDFDNASDEERLEIIDMYIDALDLRKNEIETAIQDDPQAKQMADAVKFFESVEKGETQIEVVQLTEEEYNKLTNKEATPDVNKSE